MASNDVPLLCLTSWYPNEVDIFEGDFIERKFKALSQFRKLEIIHVKKHTDIAFNKKFSEQQSENVTVKIFYHTTKKSFIGTLKYYTFFFRKHNEILKSFKAKYGKPKLILVQVPYNAGIIAWYWKQKYGIEYILTEHYGIYNPWYEYHFKTRSRMYQTIVKRIVGHAKKLLTVSHSLGKDMNEWVVEKEHQKVSNVVNTDLFFYKEKPPTTPFVFCHLSNMIPVKNVPGMLEATWQLSTLRNDFIVEFIGARNHTYEKMAQELGLLNKFVFFKDSIPYHQVAQVLQNAHALLMFSQTESQSCVSLEALCTGTPVVSSKAGGIEEHLNKKNSLLVEREDVKSLAQAMNEMIEKYPDFNKEEIAKENQLIWNYKSIGAQYNQLIEDALSQ